MLLKSPSDHATIHIRSVMTGLICGNNVMMAHELVHSLAEHLTHHNNGNTGGGGGGGGGEVHQQGSSTTTTTTTGQNSSSSSKITTSNPRDGTPGPLFMSLYPTWYRNGNPAPPVSYPAQDVSPPPPPPPPPPRQCPRATTCPRGEPAIRREGFSSGGHGTESTTFREATTRHLLLACFFFDAAGLRGAARACVAFGIRHGWHEVLEWAIGSASVEMLDGLWYGKVAILNG